MARTAERGLFDFFFLAEGLRLREHRGRIHDLDVVGRPDTFTILAALAAVTDYLGLTGTINTTFNEPFEVARQFATLDHLSDGRAGWNMVTSSDAFTGENFRRGGFLAHSDRYERAEEFVIVAREFWDSWAPDAVLADRDSGVYVDPALVGDVEHRGPQFDVRRREYASACAAGTSRPAAGGGLRRWAGVPGPLRRRGVHHALDPRGGPGVLRGRQGAGSVVRPRSQISSRSFRRPRSCWATRPPRRPRRPTTSAVSRSAHRRRSRCSSRCGSATCRATTPTAHCPTSTPADDPTITQGRVRHGDPKAVAASWRERAEADKLSIRELVIAVTSRQQFVGTPAQIADEIDLHIQSDACDGFILVPHLTPHGLDDFVDRVVPLLQERGAFRTEYTGHTLRDHLCL